MRDISGCWTTETLAPAVWSRGSEGDRPAHAFALIRIQTNRRTGTRAHIKMLATPLNHRVCHLFSSCRWLEGNRGWFLVLDDARDPSVLNALKLPKCGSILITAPDVSGWDAAVGWQVGPRTIDGHMSGNCTQNTVQIEGLESCLKEANRDLFAEHGRTRKL